MAPVSLIDSHIRLHPSGKNSVSEFNATTSSPANLEGFVLVGVNDENVEDLKDWTGPLQEISFIRRLVTGSPGPDEGHTPADAKRLLAAVPWAPVNLGSEKLGEFLAKAEETAGPEAWAKVKGFRYLLQDKPSDDLIAGLQALGRRGLAVDIGVDEKRPRRQQLEELIEVIDRAHEGVPEDQQVAFVIEHLCRPDMTIIHQADPSFTAWRTAMFALGKCRRTYIKLSGCFAVLPTALKTRPAEEIFNAIVPWLAIVMAAFGPARIMFASDWPLSNVDVGEDAWKKWHRVVERFCDISGMDEEGQKMMWSGTARKAYSIGG